MTTNPIDKQEENLLQNETWKVPMVEVVHQINQQKTKLRSKLKWTLVESQKKKNLYEYFEYFVFSLASNKTYMYM